MKIGGSMWRRAFGGAYGSKVLHEMTIEDGDVDANWEKGMFLSRIRDSCPSSIRKSSTDKHKPVLEAPAQFKAR